MRKQRARNGSRQRTESYLFAAVAIFIVALVGALVLSLRRDRLPDESAEIEPPDALAPEAPLGLTAERLLREATRAYANAKFYSDEGYVEILYERDDERTAASRRFACSLSFARPNYARMEFGRALLRSDGKTLRAEILDAAFLGQHVEKPAPLLLTSIREFYPDAEFAAAANLGLPSDVFWTSPQLVLLFSRDPFRTLAPRDATLNLLEPAYLSFDGIAAEPILCDRVEVVHDGVARVYWFSRATRALARCELSAERVLAPEQNVRVVAARVEFPNQQLLQTTPDDLAAFQFAADESDAPTRRVDRFETPEIAALEQSFPLDAIQKLDDREPDGAVVKEGVPTALCFWRSADPDSSATLHAFAALAEEYPSANFVAVDCDESADRAASARSVESGAASNLAYARLDGAALMRLDPDAPPLVAPSLALLDGSGATALYLFRSSEVARLRNGLRELFEGRDPRETARAAFFENARRFERFMESATTGELYRTSLEIAQTEPPARKTPKTMQIHEVWRYDGLFAPVNPVALSSRRREASGVESAWETVEPQNVRHSKLPEDILITPCDGNAIAILSSRGKLLQKTTPAAAAGEPITFVRAAELTGGRRYFIASASGAARKLHRFDDEFNDVGSLEVCLADAQRVGDARLADLDRDGVPEAFLGIVSAPDVAGGYAQNGIYAINMETRRVIWKDESVLAPTQLAVGARRDGSERGATLWSLDFTKVGAGAVAAYDAATGASRVAARVGKGESLRHIASATHVSEGCAAFAAICVDETADVSYFTGYDAEGRELWRNVVAPIKDDLVERIKSGDVDGDGRDDWILISGNGAIRFFNSAGVETDVFQYGARISGACLARWHGISYLVVTEPRRISAWRIDRIRR